MNELWTPLALGLVAGGGTVAGAVVLLVALPSPPGVNALSAQNASLFGRLQAASGGVMLALSFNLYFEALPETGHAWGLVYLSIGFAIMFAIQTLLHDHGADADADLHSSGSPAAIADGFPQRRAKHGEGSVSAASLAQDPLLASDDDDDNSHADAKARIASPMTYFERFLVGLFGASVASSSSSSTANTLALVRSSFVTYVGLALHNLPEGISVALTTSSNLSLGISLALAILLHNVLEGLIVALPIWYASRSRARVLLLTGLNGLFEPFGVVLVWLTTARRPDGGSGDADSAARVAMMLSGVAGVMAGIVASELVPSACLWIRRGGVAGWSRATDIEVGGGGAGVAAGSADSVTRIVWIRVLAWMAIGAVFGFVVMAAADFVVKSLGV
ncbi:hypothetical protein HDU84_008205 [Entophlyctis sp. JEL0112]|nr:hypothetical protein HDU84_008205 [Entophlyctis sp. JEL0112]